MTRFLPYKIAELSAAYYHFQIIALLKYVEAFTFQVRLLPVYVWDYRLVNIFIPNEFIDFDHNFCVRFQCNIPYVAKLQIDTSLHCSCLFLQNSKCKIPPALLYQLGFFIHRKKYV